VHFLSNSDIPSSEWRKAQMSVNNGACVEIASVGGLVAIRDSKNPSGPILSLTRTEWNSFLNGAKNGVYDFARLA
jgi:predicted secreted Zn-dependent protease